MSDKKFKQSYIVILTILTPHYIDNIISNLVKIGYEVSPASRDGKVSLTNETKPSTVLSLKLSKRSELDNLTDAPLVNKDVLKIIDDLKVLHYSIVVLSDQSDVCWCDSNILLNKKISSIRNDLN